jgi:hypothetical protein
MRGLTIHQPWAWAIATGEKPPENRGRRTHYRGPIAIHAGKTWSRYGATDPRVLDAAHRILGTALEIIPGDSPHTPRGAVVAVARLADCHPAAGGCCAPWGDDTHGDGPAYHWVLAQVQKLAVPVSCRGAQGLWPVPADVAAQIRPQLGQRRVTFDRIGRDRDVAPLVSGAGDDDLLDEIHRYARPHVRSSELEVLANFDEGRGFLTVGVLRPAGRFTIETLAVTA